MLCQAHQVGTLDLLCHCLLYAQVGDADPEQWEVDGGSGGGAGPPGPA